jgi:hypothetical protein
MRASAGLLVLGAGALLAGSIASAGQDETPPRIVAAAMVDADGDFRADRVRLTYSERVRHRRDADGRYPFTVTGYRIRSIGIANGRVVLVMLVEKATNDPGARPLIRYRATRSKPVTDTAGNEARRQSFRSVRGHGRTPPPLPPPPPPPAPTTLPPDQDPDQDGFAAPVDCAPDDPAINPAAADLPDLGFLDSNCDGIDGTEANAVFASPLGNDANPGTKAAPKREIRAAVVAVAGTGKYVLAAAGSYGRVQVATGVGIYGGYDPASWSRGLGLTTQIAGRPEGIFADAATGVALQLLSVRGDPALSGERSAYGIRAVNGSTLTLLQVTVVAGDGATGPTGANGRAGADGERGLNGVNGGCSSEGPWPGGRGGDSPVGRNGGKGGDGGRSGSNSGKPGDDGKFGTPGGKGGSPETSGEAGANGTNGAPGRGGTGGTSSTERAGTTWVGVNGAAGEFGTSGNGGGGGGGSGGKGGVLVIDCSGNAGGGGGGGGAPGRLGEGGGFGGGSFGVYLHSSALTAEASLIRAGNGGRGGRGGNGGSGGKGGLGGFGGANASSEVGRGGRGGRGGDGGVGGAGGGGAGGPSIGVMKVGGAATLTETPVLFGAGGLGGPLGTGGTEGAVPSQAGIAQAAFPA